MNKKNIMSKNPLILAVETSGRLGSVAIATGEKLLGQVVFSSPMQHSKEIFPRAEELLSRFSRKASQIEQVYISVGPGSFTGLRIAVTIAKSMNLAIGAKIVAVDTMDVIAANTDELLEKVDNVPAKIATILDAKRGQFFVAVYQNENQKWVNILPACLMNSEEFIDKFADGDKPVWLLGEGLVYYKDKFKSDGIEFFDEKYSQPQAQNVHRLGWEKAKSQQFENPVTLGPAYLRQPEVGKKLRKKR